MEASGQGRLVREKPEGGVPPGWEGFGSAAFDELKSKLQEAGVRVVLVIQRFGWTAGGLERTESLLKDRRLERAWRARSPSSWPSVASTA